MKTPEKQTDQRGGFASSVLLDGWSLETVSCGIGMCGSGMNKVLMRGNWGVIGGTGKYKLLHPSGWIEDSPSFKTELEAMLWVMGKSKPSNEKS
jgi:hypothetical protein